MLARTRNMINKMQSHESFRSLLENPNFVPPKHIEEPDAQINTKKIHCVEEIPVQKCWKKLDMLVTLLEKSSIES